MGRNVYTRESDQTSPIDSHSHTEDLRRTNQVVRNVWDRTERSVLLYSTTSSPPSQAIFPEPQKAVYSLHLLVLDVESTSKS